MKTYKDFYGMTSEEMLTCLGGFYRCPRKTLPDDTIEWLGPLAGYTSRDSKGRQRLGPEYANFRRIQNCEPALRVVAVKLELKTKQNLSYTVGLDFAFCGIPTGGRAIVEMIKRHSLQQRCIWGEKQSVGVTTKTARADKKLWFEENQLPREGEKIVLVEDVGNAFSTTEEVIRVVESYGAEVIMISLFLNRSSLIINEFLFRGRSIPVVALWTEPMPLYEQDDPMVLKAVKEGNFVLDTKKEWGMLMEAM